MKEIMINFYCPSTSKSYDFWVPKGMVVKKAIAEICDDICALESKDVFPNRDSLVLSSYLVEKTLPMELTLEQAGVKSGDRLAIV